MIMLLQNKDKVANILFDMPKKKYFTPNEKKILRRYLIWCYKTTKESLDRVERYFTQLHVDGYLFDQLSHSLEYRSAKSSLEYKALVDNFQNYMQNKEENVLKKKFFDQKLGLLNSDYQYLRNRFASLEKAIGHFLGKKELAVIERLYEEEMTRRILEAKEHS